ncbi:MAG TPA: hypothetical protein VMF51_12805 [Nocardioides sp.]|uniref:hypothetical protein n=1 Tax=Nocardioides sp. TaxID=35761 RepID=UPI002B656FEA|nr:hypothetical protein [Nocardioides sp.]HTW16006.1 hypothetical protein [Nocardioides sp.]
MCASIAGNGWTFDEIDEGTLYEFCPRPGVHVRLHDASCTEIRFDPVHRTLVVRFAFDEDYPGRAVCATYEFSDVIVRDWTDDGSDDGTDAPWRGQVTELTWDAPRTFHLGLAEVALTVEASAVVVSVT